MKRISIYLMAVCLSLTLCPVTINAAVKPLSSYTDSSGANSMLLRISEIKAMDKTTLSSTEKKDLRKELRTIKKELKKSNGGVYLSVGGIIIIILLLILLL
ncbi:MAG: hypothetical protein IPP72_13905 [Chitinophagaceae bacterium]|nr:hypothetical protein [Chitinophagaceae bacterium]